MLGKRNYFLFCISVSRARQWVRVHRLLDAGGPRRRFEGGLSRSSSLKPPRPSPSQYFCLASLSSFPPLRRFLQHPRIRVGCIPRVFLTSTNPPFAKYLHRKLALYHALLIKNRAAHSPEKYWSVYATRGLEKRNSSALMTRIHSITSGFFALLNTKIHPIF